MRELLRIEQLGDAWVGQATGVRHAHCEDRFRMLTMFAEMVVNSNRGEVYAVFDGMGSLPRGAHASQHLADRLFDYYEKPEVFERGFVGMSILLEEAADEVAGWRSDGRTRVEVCFAVGRLEELVRWVLSWGSLAKVIEPRELRQMVADEVKAMGKLF